MSFNDTFHNTIYKEGYGVGYEKGITDMYNAYKRVEKKIETQQEEARRQTRVIFCESIPELDRLMQTITWRICGITPDARYNLSVRQNSITCGPRTLDFRVYSQSAYLGLRQDDIITEDKAVEWLMEVDE